MREEAQMPARLLRCVTATMTELVGLPGTSQHEDAVREHLRQRLCAAGLAPATDDSGNLIALVPGTAGREREVPLLLNAHMDRVPPGLGCKPRVRDGVMYGDGRTNLGADDAAGITIILLAVEALKERDLAHGPLLLLFTVGEEVGLLGARAFDPTPWQVCEGIIFDNAGEPGAVVTRGAAYLAFDAVLRGRGGHPGKDLAGTASAVAMFLNLRLPLGSLDDGATRLAIGQISAGTARNAIPAELTARGELRTLLGPDEQAQWMDTITTAFQQAAASCGGTATVTFDPHGSAYAIDEREPLVQAYRRAWEVRGQPYQTMATFVGSDANALRDRLRVFTVSTGAMNEHTLEEHIALAPLVEMIEATVAVAQYDRAGDA
jgi:tripeptide aminopeptidase